MFDKLIVSESSDIKNRRNYFMVSSLAVGILFLAAVVFSIYASDFGLGNDSFEISMVTVPPEIATVEPQPQKQQPQPAQSTQSAEKPIRVADMPRIDEIGPVPTDISTAPNTEPSRPMGEFEIGPENKITGTSTQPGPPSVEPAEVKPPEPVATKPEPQPQPAIPDPPKPPVIRSLGVITGKATYLPKPPYPAHAVAMNLQGKVDVQVMIDENGKVISANAVSGHKLLRAAAESAARNAKFDPTYLSKVPVKVTGVIVYNFSR
ncbi:MAG: TonB family protein [Pyrinomonadaceae bacterium]